MLRNMLPSGAAPKPSGPFNKTFLICVVSSKALGSSAIDGCHSTGPVVELWEVERQHPLLAAPRKDLDFRGEPLVEAIESALLHENVAREVLQVVADQPGTAVCTEDAIEPLARTGLGVRTVGEALGVPAEHGEVRGTHHRHCRHLTT